MSNLLHTCSHFLTSRFTCLSSPSEDGYRIRRKRTKHHITKYISLEELPNELFLEIFQYFTLCDIYTIFHGLNSRLNQLIAFSCVHGFAIHSTRENNLYIEHILPHIPPRQITTLKLWHNSSYEQVLNKCPIKLYC